MDRSMIPAGLMAGLKRGMAIPAIPLALDSSRCFDESRQRADRKSVGEGKSVALGGRSIIKKKNQKTKKKTTNRDNTQKTTHTS